MLANSIDEVIQKLDTIIETSLTNNNPLGYFATLYRIVTVKVKNGINSNYFDNNTRMERLDIIFANRYLDAYENYKRNNEATKSWQTAFNLATKKRPIVLQHLLIGMNAHINLDLGIAALQVMKGEDIDDLHNDFNKINTILSSLVKNVEQSLSEIWPTLKWILKISGKVDDFLIDFSMKIARDGAWDFAKNLEKVPNIDSIINLRDEKISRIGKLISNPGLIPNIIFFIIRIGERGTVKDKIEDLNNMITE